jgi:hypothetical protein
VRGTEAQMHEAARAAREPLQQQKQQENQQRSG